MTLREMLVEQGVDIEALLAWLTRYVPSPRRCTKTLMSTRTYFKVATPGADADKLLGIVASYFECDCEVIMSLIGDEE